MSKETKTYPVFCSVKDVAAIFGCSIHTAREFMHRRDFPAVAVGNKLFVLKTALEEWAAQRRV